ncbi:glycosyltransferase family 2 protein [Magnetococcales bacterium HHB-1]
MNKPLIIIPAYNEEETIAEVVRRAKPFGDLCVINDNSNDQTAEILATFSDIHVITHQQNTHIAGAILDGMRYAVEKKYDYAITMDAGLSHIPEEIAIFLAYEQKDLVIGRREQHQGTPHYRRLLSWSGNRVYNGCILGPKALLFGHYHDLTSGFRRFSYKAMRCLINHPMQSRAFDFILESVMVVHQNGLSIGEVPISYHFSNSSLNITAVKECLRMGLRNLF